MKLYPRIIILSKDELHVVKSARSRWLSYAFIIVFISLPIAGFFYIKQGQTPHWPYDLSGRVGLSLFLLFIVGYNFIVVRRTLRSCRDFKVVSKDGVIWIDRNIFSGNVESAHVFIQRVGGSNGIGCSYTVGLRSGKRIESLAYGLSEEKADQLSQELSSFLSIKLIRQENKIFTLYQGY